MSFGLNRAEVIGRLGADVTVNQLASGGRVANLSVATDESYIDAEGQRRARRPDRVAPDRDVPGRPDRHAPETRDQGPPGLRRGQAADPPLEEGRRGLRPVLDRDPARSRIGRVQFLDKPNGNGSTAPGDQPSTLQANATPEIDAGDTSDLPFE